MTIKKDHSVHTLKELFSDEISVSSSSSDKLPEHDIEYFCRVSDDIGFGKLSSPRFNVLIIKYPLLSHMQIKFLVSILRNVENKILESALEYCCKASIVNRGQKKALIINYGFIRTELNNKTYTFNSKFFIEILIEMWSHLQTNENNLWLNGKGEPDVIYSTKK
jgi:hypothetical protein